MKNHLCLQKVVDTTLLVLLWIGDFKRFVCSKNRQKSFLGVGDMRIVRIIEDDETSRLIGVEKNHFIFK